MRIGAIDQGTTSTRCLVIDEAGSRQVVKAMEHQQIYPQPGWVEHDPIELITNIRTCLEAAGPLDAFGIDNQGESCVAWHAETKEPLSPVIVWQDERSSGQIRALKEQGGEALTLARAGLPLDPYFSASKLAWMIEKMPAIASALAQGVLRLGTTDAFFVDHLTGRFITDVATASRTSLMALETCQWDADLCALFGVPMECLPEIVSNTGDFGGVTTSSGPIALTSLITDQQAALFGAGCREKGDAKITFGTGAFALSVTGKDLVQAPDRGLLPTIAWRKENGPATYALDGGVLTAGAAINWARELGLFGRYSEIERFERPPAIDNGLTFVPALAGLGCPHWDRQAKGAWIGLGLSHTSSDLMQALLEGIALRASEVLVAMDETSPLKGGVAIDGGLTKNGYFLEFFTDCLGREVLHTHEPEVTALGTALLAAEAIGAELGAPGDRMVVRPREVPAERRRRFAKAIHLSRAWECG